MGKANFFLPVNPTDFSSCVIAIPGIVAEDEPTRINLILEELSKNHGVMGIRLNYVEKEERDQVIVYKFNLDNVVEDMGNLIRRATLEFKVNPNRIGLLSNSISAIPATEYLANSRNKLRCYASISPLLGWNYFTNPEIREYIGRERPDLELSCQEGRKRKVISKSMIPELMNRDALRDLEGYQKDGMKVLTIVGTRDKKSDPESMKRYHKTLGGKDEGLILLDEGHEVPNSNGYVVNFFSRHLETPA
jgi:hypothetical protein